ncbi:aspartyl-phosphate phosphatase Spo0E family protein [Pontibacillus sp. ALD_SL1]|uniref:aspartyl-phosphate phosphatase Spo0E family protein n=1 Tax=Pontibacillus sp. ALD_SL1 TaxID=2777185 RepID=UPI001F612CD0|nr:aspartyl-phosphate phosphatase Spo0E family protein [Pontibacillus sp. ALD_SL1]
MNIHAIQFEHPRVDMLIKPSLGVDNLNATLSTPKLVGMEIEKKRKEMVDSAIQRGFNDEYTLQLSQELDQLLNKWNTINTITSN